MLTAAAVLVSAAVHLYLRFDGAREEDFLGSAFMLDAIAGDVFVALALGWRRQWGPAVPPARLRALYPEAFVISTTVAPLE